MSKVQTELTSKKFKLMIILCRLAYIVAFFWAAGIRGAAELNGGEPNYTKPIILFVAAVLVALVNRFLIWWNHG